MYSTCVNDEFKTSREKCFTNQYFIFMNLNSYCCAGAEGGKELTTEEMRKLIERNEIVQTNGMKIKPFNTVNL